MEGPIELAVVAAGITMVEGDVSQGIPTSKDFMRDMKALGGTLLERRELAKEMDPGGSEHELAIYLNGALAKMAVSLIEMSSLRHANPVTKAAAAAMMKDYQKHS